MTREAIAWPRVTKEMRPWAYWWWMGSAVDEANLTRELTRYEKAGMGGVHIIPIYGARGFEERYVPYLSDRWLALLAHTIREAHRLGLGVDLTLGTGWCFGGPTVSDSDANASLVLTPRPEGGLTLSQKPSGQKVKRAAPGGVGHMLDPFSVGAMERYLAWFDAALARYSGPKPRAVYQDSYEYNANTTPAILTEFAQRRGYRLEPHLAALLPSAPESSVRADYRATLAELQVEAQAVWTRWARKKGFVSRYEAHGSPGNLLDLYALADIPETEMFRDDRSILVSKMASSAAHLTGKRLTSSETGTWLREHFTETPTALKQLVDRLFLSGINHVFWHGTCYSPDEAPWPGWVFYASTQANPRNPLWRVFPALHRYIARCQSVLQRGAPGTDFLVYWPLHDYWHEPSPELARKLTVHQRAWLEGQPIGPLAQRLFDRGWHFDFVSDQLLAHVALGRYRAVVVPPCRHLPAATWQRLDQLQAQGVRVLFAAGLSSSALEAALAHAGAQREPLADLGLACVRRTEREQTERLIVNPTDRAIAGWVPLGSAFATAAVLDPMTGATGVAATQGQAVWLTLPPHGSLLVRTRTAGSFTGKLWPRYEPQGVPIALTGTWEVVFLDGGPTLPPAFTSPVPCFWTGRGAAYDAFSGTARYTLTFDAPQGRTGPWRLDLGQVETAAEVRLNGKSLGTLLLPPFTLDGVTLRPRGNRLEIDVTNLAANRIRDLDRRKVAWRTFQDINFVNSDYKPFDASEWPVRPAGLAGPVQLVPLAP